MIEQDKHSEEAHKAGSAETSATAKEEGRAKVAGLVERFRTNQKDYLSATYNETQVRTEFISPFLEALGWDVHNLTGKPLAFRDVIEEATVEVGEERLSKRPDYELRIARPRKLFIEAKKPSVKIESDRAPAFQTRRYGYSASLPVSVVTNFNKLVIYDCLPVPAVDDEAHVARLAVFDFEELFTRFDEVWSLISRESVFSGEFDRRFAVGTTRQGAQQFDDFFLSQVRDWRSQLAIDMFRDTPDLSSEELTYAVQLVLSRIVFLRICEDRDIEKYETLRNLSEENTFDAFQSLLRRADAFYDSGLFRIIDDENLGIQISDGVLYRVISELYYPQSPYTFAVIEAEVLGEIYEQFLGEVIHIDSGDVEVVTKPEVRESGGVVPTPSFIADAIVARTVGPLVIGKGPDELAGFTIADTCCGSGIFLLSAYNFLLGHYLSWYTADDVAAYNGKTIFQLDESTWRLTFDEKRRILLEHLRGVDIDANAVEVAQFSLLLKLVEDETEAALQEFLQRTGEKALPDLDLHLKSGNSLVCLIEWDKVYGSMKPEQLESIDPFSWQDEFPLEMGSGGFDVVVGNPPYIRIQNMITYSPDEVAFYHDVNSPYTTARQDNFDKYSLFVERSLALVKDSGRVGVIIPNKFLTIRSGKALRSLLSSTSSVDQVIDFGVKQVFGKDASNYTCIVVLDKGGIEQTTIEKPGPLEEWRYGKAGAMVEIPTKELTDEAWNLGAGDVRSLFDRVRAECPKRLVDLADIEVGVQTSADDIYLFEATASDEKTYTLVWNGREWPIERGVVRPCLRDVSLQPFGQPEANAWMIFPYELVPRSNGKIRARVLQPDEMRSQFPKCYEYLEARRAELEKRSITGGAANEQQWYQYGRSQSLTKFDTPKIILPVLAQDARYAYDETDTMITGGGNGPYYMVRSRQDSPVSTIFILAVLNHPFCEAMIRTNTSVFRGGYYSHGKQFISDLPIPLPRNENEAREIEDLAAQVVAAVQRLNEVKIGRARVRQKRIVDDLRRRLEQRISDLLGLDDADLSVIESVPIPS